MSVGSRRRRCQDYRIKSGRWLSTVFNFRIKFNSTIAPRSHPVGSAFALLVVEDTISVQVVVEMHGGLVVTQ